METMGAGAEGRAFADLIDDDGPVYVVEPHRPFVGGLLDALEDADDAAVRLLASAGTRRDFAHEFGVESRLAAAVAAGTLELRELPSPPGERLVVGVDECRLLVSLDGVRGAIETLDGSLVAGLRRKYARRWAASETVALRSPPREELLATARDRVGDGFAEALGAAIDGADALPWAGTPSPTHLVVAVAATREALLHDAGEWCDDVGLASRSSFSRAKGALEEAGLVASDRVVKGVGRPRQRLVVADDALAAAAPGETAGVLAERLD